MKKSYVIRTKDFEECAILYFSGLPIEKIEPEGRACWFYFVDNEHKAQEIINNFHNANIKGNIKDFCNAQSTIRKRFKSIMN